MKSTLRLGHSGLLKPEVDLIATILRTSALLESRWELTDSDVCDAFVTDKLDAMPPLQSSTNTAVILLKRRGLAASGYVFYKPFKAAEIVDTLLAIMQNSQHPINNTRQTKSTEQTKREAKEPPLKAYRLKKWPPVKLTSLHKDYMLLSAYLARGPKTLSELLTLSGLNETVCTQFLSLLEQHHLLDAETTVPTTPNREASNVSMQKKSFFSSLKKRLGLLGASQ